MRTGSTPTAVSGPCAGMALDGESTSIAAARAFTARFLAQAAAEYGVTAGRQALADAQLVVSELVTNSVKYAPGPCAVRLEITGGRLEVTVWDTGTSLPEPRPPEPGRVGQHGLEIVLALCEDVEVRSAPVGKRITARAVLTAGPADGSTGRDGSAPAGWHKAPQKTGAETA
ncbi:ATP-binding protein [Actinacidiphila acididurans]|nr:ATP-binding protein [Actinacidiphila acididurans]